MANWISLADTKTYLWISWTSQDDRLNLIIPWVQAMIENVIWDISKWDKTERIRLCDITKFWEIFVCFDQITELKKIAWTTYTWSKWVDYMIEENKITINDISQYLVNLDFNSFTVTYEAWYDPIPADIQNVMYQLVWQELNKKEWWLIKKYTLWPRTVELDNTNWQADWLINSIEAVLWKYKIFKIYL